MKRACFLKRASLALLGCLVGAAAAAAGETGPYVRVDAGGSWAQDAEIKDTKFDPLALPICANQACTAAGKIGDTDTGSVISFGAGYQVTPLFRLDVTYDHNGGFDLKDRDGFGAIFDGKIASNAWMVNGYVDLPFKIGMLSPYIGAGIGSSEVKIKNFTVTDTTVPVTINLPNGSERSFAWQIMTGVTVGLTDKLMLDLGYRYFDGGDIKIEPDTANLFNGYEGEWRTHDVTAGLRYKF